MNTDTARRALEALLAANERLAAEAAKATKGEARANHELRHLSAELGRTRNLTRVQQSELAEARDTITRLQTLVDEQIEIIRGLRAAIRNEIASGDVAYELTPKGEAAIQSSEATGAQT